MPLINIRVLKGTLSDEKKSEMIERVSKTVSEIEASPHAKDNLLAYPWCIIEEVPFEHWGMGGNAVSPEILAAVLEGKA